MKISTKIIITIAAIAIISAGIYTFRKKLFGIVDQEINPKPSDDQDKSLLPTKEDLQYLLKDWEWDIVARFTISDIDYTEKKVNWGAGTFDNKLRQGSSGFGGWVSISDIKNQGGKIYQTYGELRVEISYWSEKDKMIFELKTEHFGDIGTVYVNFASKQIEKLGVRTEWLK